MAGAPWGCVLDGGRRDDELPHGLDSRYRPPRGPRLEEDEMTMKPFVLTLLAACFLAAPSGVTHAQEPALNKTATDADLQWSPCPPGLPEGCTLSVLHGDPGKPNADIFLKLPAKSTIAEHWHTSAERMILVSGEMQVTYKGQPTTTLRAGAYAYGPAKLSHSAACVSAAPCVLFIAFELPVDLVPTAK